MSQPPIPANASPCKGSCAESYHLNGSTAQRECERDRALTSKPLGGRKLGGRTLGGGAAVLSTKKADRYREPDVEYASMEELSEGVTAHFASTDMPSFVRCYRTDKGFGMEKEVEVPYSVSEPDGYKGDDDLYYWGANTPYTNDLRQEGYTLKSMHSSEHPSPSFVRAQSDERIEDGEAVTMGCVIVSFDEEESEWAWVTSD